MNGEKEIRNQDNRVYREIERSGFKDSVKIRNISNSPVDVIQDKPHKDIRFIDLFGGIGGFRLGLERANDDFGSESDLSERWEENIGSSQSLQYRRNKSSNKIFFTCVGYYDNDRYAVQTYNKNFGENYQPSDIRKVSASEIPDHELLCAGFPCQAFSIAGKRKGFEDTRGTLFFEIARIIEAKRPEILLLENVKGLLSHDEGRTFGTILRVLDGLGYDVEWQVLNSKDFGVPQNRERVFIVGRPRERGGRKIFPIGEGNEMAVAESEQKMNINPVGTICANYYKHQEPFISYFNRSGAEIQRIYNTDGISPTLHNKTGGWQEPKIAQAVLTPNREKKRQHGRRFKENNEEMFTLTKQDIHGVSDGMRIRRLTPVECERLQGFPDNWTSGVSDTQRYRQMGNAVTVNVIEFLGRKILEKKELR